MASLPAKIHPQWLKTWKKALPYTSKPITPNVTKILMEVQTEAIFFIPLYTQSKYKLKQFFSFLFILNRSTNWSNFFHSSLYSINFSYMLHILCKFSDGLRLEHHWFWIDVNGDHKISGPELLCHSENIAGILRRPKHSSGWTHPKKIQVVEFTLRKFKWLNSP